MKDPDIDLQAPSHDSRTRAAGRLMMDVLRRYKVTFRAWGLVFLFLWGGGVKLLEFKMQGLESRVGAGLQG